MRLSSLILMILTLGCGKDDSSSTPTEEFSAEGTWRAECEDVEDSGSIRASRTYSSKKVTMTTFFYNDEECDGEAHAVKTRVYKYEIGDAVSGLTNTYKVDYEVDSIEYELLTSGEVDSCNDLECYGFTDWEVESSKEIAGLELFPGVGLELEIGEEAFNIIKVSGDELYIGDLDTGDGSSDDERPTAVNDSDVFEKQ
jgi:hypothetical protein